MLNVAAAGFGCFLMTSNSESQTETGKWIAIAGLSSGISSLFLGYAIQLLFECRNYLRKLTEK